MRRARPRELSIRRGRGAAHPCHTCLNKRVSPCHPTGFLPSAFHHAVPRLEVGRQSRSGRSGGKHVQNHHVRTAVLGLQRHRLRRADRARRLLQGRLPAAQAAVGLPPELVLRQGGTGRGAHPEGHPVLSHQQLGWIRELEPGRGRQQPAVRRELYGHGMFHDPHPESAAGRGRALPHAGHLHRAGEPGGPVRHPAVPHPPLPAVLPFHRQPGHRRPAGQRDLRLQLPGLPRVPPQGQPQRVPVQTGRRDGLLHRLRGKPLPHRHRPLRVHPPAAGVQAHRDAHQGCDRLLHDVGDLGGDRRAAAAGLELQAAQLGVLGHLPAHRRELPDVLDRRHQRPGHIHRVRVRVHPVEGAPPRREDAEAHVAEEPGGAHGRRHQGADGQAGSGPHGHPPGQDAGADPGRAGDLLGAPSGHHGVRPVLADGRQHQDGVRLLQHAHAAQLHRQPHHLRPEEQGPAAGLPGRLPRLQERIRHVSAAGQQPGVGLSEQASSHRQRASGRELRQDHCENSQNHHVRFGRDVRRGRVSLRRTKVR